MDMPAWMYRCVPILETAPSIWEPVPGLNAQPKTTCMLRSVNICCSGAYFRIRRGGILEGPDKVA